MTLDHETRQHLERCRSSLPSSAPQAPVVFGFDGVVDRVRTVVAERTGPEQFERMTSLEEFGSRITDSAALDASCSIEWFERGTRPGGHVSHLGRAFERLGATPTLVGTFGEPPVEAFREEYDRARLVSIGEPSTTDAIEFDDGKVMLSDSGRLSTLDWGTLREAVGLEDLAEHVDRSAAMGTGYWSTVPRLPTIWRGLADDLWPVLSDPPRAVLVDPGDVRRLGDDRRSGLDELSALDRAVPVTVSANRPECDELAAMCGIADPLASLSSLAGELHERLGVSRFVGHSVSTATVATADGTASVSVPRCPDPVLTTSAGDHFNAGLLLAHRCDVRGGAALVVANALAGWFVRTGRPPTYDELREFVDEYDEQFEGESESKSIDPSDG
ncbi:hypothetical protein [Halomontanus rarus]|uniref:hypothetical protein n=1 Tax=Halomontanus rarus TaxID=3034020 RepID=UPI0023E80D26|nr:hypothetical protein [Halovivax sp. TS33]